MREGKIAVVTKRDSPVPLYLQIKDYIRLNIKTGVFAVGSKIPSERQLAEQFGVNRLTVNKAISELAQEGVLSSQVGKGTYVCPPKINQTLQSLTSFTEDMQNRGQVASSRVLAACVEGASDEVAQELSILPGTEVFKLVRLRLADGQVIALEESHLVYALCPGIVDQFDFTHESLYRVLREHYGLRLTHARQVMEAQVARGREYKDLDLKPGMPVLKIVRVTYNDQNRPIEYVRSVYRGDRYKFHTILRQME